MLAKAFSHHISGERVYFAMWQHIERTETLVTIAVGLATLSAWTFKPEWFWAVVLFRLPVWALVPVFALAGYGGVQLYQRWTGPTKEYTTIRIDDEGGPYWVVTLTDGIVDRMQPICPKCERYPMELRQYPSGSFYITKAGCPHCNYEYKWDKTADKVREYVERTATGMQADGQLLDN
jgi:hypothetical protein